MPRFLKLAYVLRGHALGNWSLERWLIGLALAAAAWLTLLRLPRLLAGDAPGLWLLPLLLVVVAGLIVLYARWAAGQAYVVFVPEPETAPPAGRMMLPAAKVMLRATGQFEVEGKTRTFAHLLAYWRTFASREHAVMAIVHASRYLLAVVPERNLGMWYIFFCPDSILSLAPGRLTFGGATQPALQVTYQPPRPPAAPPHGRAGIARPRPLPAPRTVYLSFDDHAGRDQVWADMLADAAGT